MKRRRRFIDGECNHIYQRTVKGFNIFYDTEDFLLCLTILHYNRDKVKIHPTQKPVELVRYLIRTYSSPDETILDNCMGSGTTAIAAIKEHRHYIGFELNSEYYEKAINRIKSESQQTSLFDL